MTETNFTSWLTWPHACKDVNLMQIIITLSVAEMQCLDHRVNESNPQLTFTYRANHAELWEVQRARFEAVLRRDVTLVSPSGSPFDRVTDLHRAMRADKWSRPISSGPATLRGSAQLRQCPRAAYKILVAPFSRGVRLAGNDRQSPLPAPHLVCPLSTFSTRPSRAGFAPCFPEQTDIRRCCRTRHWATGTCTSGSTEKRETKGKKIILKKM